MNTIISPKYSKEFNICAKYIVDTLNTLKGIQSEFISCRVNIIDEVVIYKCTVHSDIGYHDYDFPIAWIHSDFEYDAAYDINKIINGYAESDIDTPNINNIMPKTDAMKDIIASVSWDFYNSYYEDDYDVEHFDHSNINIFVFDNISKLQKLFSLPLKKLLKSDIDKTTWCFDSAEFNSKTQTFRFTRNNIANFIFDNINELKALVS